MPLCLGRNSYINNNEYRNDSNGDVYVGSYTSIARGVSFLGKSNHYSVVNRKCVTNAPFGGPQNSDGGIYIGSDVWIGTNAIILPEVAIGHGAIVGAGCVVTKDVPPYAVVVGNSQRIVKYRFCPNTIQKLLDIAWWEWPDGLICERKEYFQDVDSFVEKFHRSDLRGKETHGILFTEEDVDMRYLGLLSIFCGALFGGEDGRAFIQSEPAGASIFLVAPEGKKDTGSKTPALVQLPKGKQTINLVAKGFKEATVNVEVADVIAKPEKVILSPIVVRIDMVFEEGWQVFVDGKPAKVETPCTVELPLGSREIGLAKDGFMDIKQRITVGEDGVKQPSGTVTSMEIKTRPSKGYGQLVAAAKAEESKLKAQESARVVEARKKVAGTYSGSAATWQSRFVLSVDGTFVGGGGNPDGKWKMNGERLVIQWNHWGEEELESDGKGGYAGKNLSLTPTKK